MSTAAPEAPPSPAIIPSTTVITETKPDPVFKDIFNTPENAPARDISKVKPEPKKPEAKETPAKRTETPPDASKAKTGDKTADTATDAQKAPKSRLDAIEAVKRPDAEGKTAEKTDVQSTEDTPPEGKDGQSRWMQLKAIEKEHNTLKPSFEAMKKELEDFKVKGFIPEDTQKELERLRQRYAVDEVTNSPEFQREVSAPIQSSFRTIGDVAKSAGLNEAESQALLNAVRNTSEVQRSDAIWDIISSIRVEEKDADGETQKVPLPDDKITRYATKIVAAADALHNQHWPKEVEYMRKAQDISKAAQEKEVEETAQERVKKEESMSKEANRLTTILKERLPLVFEEHPDAEEALKGARPSKEIEDQIFDAQSGHMVTFLAKTLNSALKKIQELESTATARSAAKPKLDGDVKKDTPKADGNKISWSEAFGTQR